MDEGSGHRSRHNSLRASGEQVLSFARPELLLSSSALDVQHVPQESVWRSDAADLTDGVLPGLHRISRTSHSLDVDHASPLAPLRDRDNQALNEMFSQYDRPEITLDIQHYLARIYPEPCWEDEPYDFLNGYI